MSFFDKYLASRSIRSHVVLISSSAMIPGIVVMVLLSWNLFQDKLSHVEAQTQSLAQIAVLKHQDAIGQSHTLLDTLARFPLLATDDTELIRNLFLKIVRENAQYEYLCLARPDGLLMASTLPSRASVGFVDQDQFRSALNTKTFSVGHTAVSDVTGLPVLPFAAPIMGDSGDVHAVLLFGLRFEQYEAFLSSLSAPLQTRFVLIDSEGTRLFRVPPDKRTPFGGKISDSVRAMLLNNDLQIQTFRAFDPMGEAVTYTYRPLVDAQGNNGGLGILVGVPTPSFIEQIWPLLWRLLVAFALVALGVLAVAIFMSKRVFMAGLVALERQLALIKGHKRLEGVHIPPSCREIVVLANAFNQLLKELQKDELQRSIDEQLVRNTALRYRTLLEASTDAIHILDGGGNLVECSGSFLEMLGYSSEEALRLNVRDWDVQINIDEKLEQFNHLGSEHFTFETSHRCKDGRILNVEVKIRRVFIDGADFTYASARDITQRKIIEEALQESVNNFRAFFETMTDLIWVGTAEGRILFTNQAVTDKLGFTLADLSGMHLLDVHPEDKRQEAETIFGEMFAGTRDVCPLPLVAKNGTLLPVETRIWFGTWDGKQCVFGISKDLTIEQDARQRFERLFHNNPALMAVTDFPERRFVDVNDALVRTTGYRREELLGHTAEELGLIINGSRQKLAAEQLVAQGRFSNLSLQVRCKDGSVREGLFSGEIICSQGQNYALTVMVDVTERVRAEAMLRASEERLDLALQATKAGLWDWNILDGGVIANERFSEMLGYTPEELAPIRIETWMRLCHPDDLPAARLQLDQHFARQRDHYTYDFRMRHKDGRWLWIRSRGCCVVWTEDGRAARMVGTHVDISAQVHDMMLREEMERIIRHDMRSPASSAISVARMLAHSLALSPEDRDLARLLERSGQQLLDMLNQSLDLYKIETGEYAFSAESVDVLAMTRELAATMTIQREHLGKRVDILVERELSDSSITVRGSTFLLRMALQNLLQNALEASSQFAPVVVEILFGSEIRIIIRNAGVVPAEVRTRFFEKYVTSGKHKGTGLGTYSAKRMVDVQGGRVSMQTSDEANETSIEVSFPNDN